MPVKYPDSFIEKVMGEYPGRDDVLQAARAGEYGLGKLLQEGTVCRMAPEDVVRHFHEGEEDLILKEAQAVIRRRTVHAEWMRMVVRRIEKLEAEPPASQRSGILRLRQRLLPGRPDGNGTSSRTAPVVALALAHKA